MWLLQEAVAQAMQSANYTASEVVAFEATVSAREQDSSRILNVAGNTAEIDISGVLTNRPNFFAQFFGGGNTTYSEITAALAQAEADPEVSEIILAVDRGPGGEIDGLFDTIAAIQAVSKPIIAKVKNMAASATFALVAQADKIIVANEATRVGSVGVVIEGFVDKDVVTITSTEAPDKRPDLSTKKGQAVIRAQLDGLHELFAGAIATGRGTNIENVNAEFGRGALVLAKDALSRGMIDGIGAAKTTKTSTAASIGGTNPKGKTMDLNELKAKHPELVIALVGEGVTKERDRVMGHLKLGKQTGATETAFNAITEGTEMTASITADYIAAGMNAQDIKNRQADDKEGDPGAGNDDKFTAEEAGQNVLEFAANLCGVKLEA